jgi:hypothetical protein
MARPKKDTEMPYREEDTLKELYLGQKKTLAVVESTGQNRNRH